MRTPTVLAHTNMTAVESRPRIDTLPPKAVVLVAVLVLIYAVAFLDRQIIALMVGPIRAAFGVSDLQLGLLQGIGFALFYTVFGLPLGWVADVASRRMLIFAGVIVWSLSASASAFATTFGQLFIARLGVGAGEAALLPAAYSMLADALPRRCLSTALAAFAGGASLGAAVSVTAGGYLVGYAVTKGVITLPIVGSLRSWQFVYLMTGLPGFAIALLIFGVREPLRKSARSSVNWETLVHFLRDNARLLAGHFLGFSMIQLMAFALASWAPTYLMRRFHWGVAEVGLTFGLQALGTIATGLLMGVFVDRQFSRGRTDAHFQIYMIFCPIIVMLVATAFISRVSAVFVLFYSLAIGLLPMAGIASSALQIATPPVLRGRISALYVFVVNIVGLGLGPAMPGIFTKFIFHDESKLGMSLIATILLAAPLSVLGLGLACGPMREAVARAEAARV